MMTVEQKYLNDSDFHALVDTMAHSIKECRYTPSEMREAAVFACVIVEMNRTPEEIVALHSTSPNTDSQKCLCIKSTEPIQEGFYGLYIKKECPVHGHFLQS